jgi:hypothetical protein
MGTALTQLHSRIAEYNKDHTLRNYPETLETAEVALRVCVKSRAAMDDEVKQAAAKLSSLANSNLLDLA